MKLGGSLRKSFIPMHLDIVGMNSKPKTKRKKVLYDLDGLRVPLAYIKKVYEGNYLPPLTPEIVEKLYYQAKEKYHL